MSPTPVQFHIFQNRYILRQFMRSGLYVPTLHELQEQIELQAKLLNYFLGSNKSNINQFCSPITQTRVPDNMFLPAAQKVHSRDMTVDLY